MLIDEAARWAASKGADRLRLWVDDRNPEGVAFYRALGFAPLGTTRPTSPGAAELESGFELILPAR